MSSTEPGGPAAPLPSQSAAESLPAPSLPHPSPARVGALRASWRLACCIAMVVQGVAVCLLVLPWLSRAGRMRQVGGFSRRMLRALGLRLESDGLAVPGPLMIVANHVSWLDILAINAVHTASFVSKSDVRHWPVIGWMVACGGTLFIDRERKRDAMRVVHQVAAALQAGDVIAVFPEGTTSNGLGLLPFHANLLQAAVATGTPVQCIALRYADDGAAVSMAAPYIDDMTLVQSLWAVASARGLRVRLSLLAPEPSAGQDRRGLSERLRARIGEALAGDAAASVPR